MIRVYGYSDDIVTIEGDVEEEIDCFKNYVRIFFSDGAVIQISYGKNGTAIWMICIEKHGTGNNRLVECNDEDAHIYSDIYETDAEMINYNFYDM